MKNVLPKVYQGFFPLQNYLRSLNVCFFHKIIMRNKFYWETKIILHMMLWAEKLPALLVVVFCIIYAIF